MSSVWGPSVELMLLGMGTVFVFLTLLVLGMIVMSNLINKIAPRNSQTTDTTQANQSEIAAVAAAAYAASKN